MELREDIENLLDGYFKWLKDSTKIDEVDEADESVTLSTPHIDRHNDMLQMIVKRTENGYELSDDGYILADLAASGCHMNSLRRKAILTETLNGFGVRNVDEMLVTHASKDNFPRRKHSLVQAMLAVNDIFYVASPQARSVFSENVQNWLGKKRVRYVRNSQFAGKSGYTHTFDFVIPAFDGVPERVIKAINKPNRQATLNFIAAWQDVRPVRPKIKPYALLNSANNAESERVVDALQKYEITPMQWSEREQFAKQLAA